MFLFVGMSCPCLFGVFMLFGVLLINCQRHYWCFIFGHIFSLRCFWCYIFVLTFLCVYWCFIRVIFGVIADFGQMLLLYLILRIIDTTVSMTFLYGVIAIFPIFTMLSSAEHNLYELGQLPGSTNNNHEDKM